jgi:iron complex transport system ATP-binding protein
MTLELLDATVKAGSAVLLDRLSLKVKPGCLTAVLGPNGAGKSTALAALAGDARLASGESSLDGVPLRKLPRSILARRRAVVAQHPPLSFPLFVHEVIDLAQSAVGGGVLADLTAQALAEADVLHLAGRDYTTLSGGERQRVQIARAFAQLEAGGGEHGARYLLLDEPTAHLDLKHQVEALNAITRLAKRGVGVLCILHDPNLALDYADEAFLIKNGRAFSEGPPEAVLTPDGVGALYDLPPKPQLRSAATGTRL